MKTLLLLLMGTLTQFIVAQEILVQGTVLDESGLPLPGVNIIEKGTTDGTQTDFDGNYEIEAHIGAVLVFTYVGYKTYEAEITIESGRLDHTMEVDDTTLSEVVVTGFASKKERKALGYAVRIRGLAGKIAGIHVGDGLPGGATMVSMKAKYPYGLLTAAEIHDIGNWEGWSDAAKSAEAKEVLRKWGVTFGTMTEVQVRDKRNEPLANVQVALYRDKERLMTATTDTHGMAYLFQHPENKPGMERYRVQVYAGEILKGKEINRGTASVDFVIDTYGNPVDTVDVMFTIDATGSMGDEMNYLKSELVNIFYRLDKKIRSKRLALTFYRDQGDEFVVRNFDFNTDITKMQHILKMQNADGGGDYEEAVEEALMASMEQDWQSNTKLLFLLLDAPPHFTERNVEIIKSQIRKAQEKGIKIIPIVASDANKEVEFLMRYFSISTNGTYVFLTDDSGIGNDHLEPTASDYTVEKLNDLIVRLIEKYAGLTA